MKTQIINCAHCNAPKLVKTADIARGWGKFCSRSCKAKEQEKRTHAHSNYLQGRKTDFSKTTEFCKPLTGAEFSFDDIR